MQSGCKEAVWHVGLRIPPPPQGQTGKRELSLAGPLPIVFSATRMHPR
jgi:hypothetical protein